MPDGKKGYGFCPHCGGAIEWYTVICSACGGKVPHKPRTERKGLAARIGPMSLKSDAELVQVLHSHEERIRLLEEQRSEFAMALDQVGAVFKMLASVARRAVDREI